MTSALHPMMGTRYMVSAGHYLATQAAFDILEAGGNAIDAGVAANLALGVLQSDQVNIAGVAPMLIYLGDRREMLTISGLGGWPQAVSCERFAKDFGEVPLGILRTVVPAAPDANIQALQRYGTLSFADVAKAAIRYARDGFSMHALMAAYITQFQDNYRLWPENERIYLPGGKVPAVGERFVQADLARSLQFMADEETAHRGKGRVAALEAAREAFYRGDLAQTILAYHRDNGGLLTAEDMADYRSAIEPPTQYRLNGFGDPVDVFTCGPWSQGPVMLQMLRLLEGFDLRALKHNSADYLHVVAEAIKLSFADRERYYGDPRFVDVPLDRLLSDDYTAERRELIRPHEAWPQMPEPGQIGNHPGLGWRSPTSAENPRLPGDTSYVCVVDESGNVFSCNPSDVTWDSPVIPGTGLCPSARGSQSWAVAGHASSVAPGKRPRLTPNPCLAWREGDFMMPIGTPGGDTQPQAILQVLLNRLVFGMNTQAAIDAPRVISHSQPDTFSPHTAYPGRLAVEGRIDHQVGEALAGKGHDIQWLDDMTWEAAGVCLIEKDLKTGVLWGGADPRRPASAMGW